MVIYNDLMWSKKQYFWIYGLICGINNVFNLRNLCLVKSGWYFIMLKWDILYDCFEIFIDHMELSQNEDSVLVYGHFDRMNTRWSFRFWGTAGTQFGTPKSPFVRYSSNGSSGRWLLGESPFDGSAPCFLACFRGSAWDIHVFFASHS